MLDEKDIWMQQERYADLLREAERERIIRQALGRKKPDPFHKRTLRWLELYRVAWRCYLQQRDAFGVFDGKEVTLHALTVASCDGDHA